MTIRLPFGSTGLGYDSTRIKAVGLGLGLERLAMLHYGIDDIRMVEAERV
ncbi:MAG: hypothetical protein O2782_10295 [bacterium]|nr:hypothetical protein [bacterium]